MTEAEARSAMSSAEMMVVAARGEAWRPWRVGSDGDGALAWSKSEQQDED